MYYCIYMTKQWAGSIRLPGWDYRFPNAYFITICTKNRNHFFGEIHNGIMGLSDIGCVVAQQWKKTQHIRPNVYLDSWIIMPNHIHGIIRLYEPWDVGAPRGNDVGAPRRGAPTGMTTIDRLQFKTSTDVGSTVRLPRLSPDSVGSIINQFKSVCTKRIRAMGHIDFAWQARFYDHIIRDAYALQRIRFYIRRNPVIWWRDRNNLDIL